LDAKWLPGHRWVAELDGEVAGWTSLTRCRPASATPASRKAPRTSPRIVAAAAAAASARPWSATRFGPAEAAGPWALQTAILTENHASIARYHGAGYRTVGVRERIGQRNGTWHDTVLIERHAAP
jgi:L-amino acid N-acyltransferase YncA